ncbi:MAG: F0F1 ATP synthase subunit epsilon [Muribaculaceae bacterium]|nr:F0F1 ATP synthase subunit epsilon [Muribaculaceae bacterium]
MILKIISTEDILFEGEVKLVRLPGQQGAFTVLHNHASLISTLVPGEISYEKPDGSEGEPLSINGGIVDVDSNVVSVCIY